MNFKIRRGVFETNSSSTHSVSISRKGYTNGWHHLNNTILTITPGEFGWGPEILYSVGGKLSYIVTAIMYYENVGYTEVGRTRAFKRLQKVIQDFCGLEVRYDPVCEGHIDHQSIGEFWFPDDYDDFKEYMLNLIFNGDSYIEISNDNIG